MRRYIRSYRTRQNVRDTNALRDQFLRQLTEEATTLLTQLSQQFTTELQNQSTVIIRNLTQAGASNSVANSINAGPIGGIGTLLSTGIRYLVTRPRTSSSTQETSRSQNAEVNFKLSRAQQLAEAGIQLNKGEKNV